MVYYIKIGERNNWCQLSFLDLYLKGGKCKKIFCEENYLKKYPLKKAAIKNYHRLNNPPNNQEALRVYFH